MSWFRRPPPKGNPLLGKWRTDPADTKALENFGDVGMKFDDAGKLTYVVHGDGGEEPVFMTYSVDGGVMITDQPSHPNPIETEWAISADDVLTLSLDGVSARFLRE